MARDLPSDSGAAVRKTAVTISAVVALFAGVASAQQAVPTFKLVDPNADCRRQVADSDDIVVCGRKDESSQYRIPPDLRGTGPIDSRNTSRVARNRDDEVRSRYGSQTVGPSGYLQYSRQIDCEWRVARQQAQSRQLDCNRRIRGDDATDWRRAVPSAGTPASKP